MSTGSRLASAKPWKAYGRYGSVGIELVLSLLLGLWGGSKLDARFGLAPWCTLAGMAIGAYAGFRVVWQAAKHMQRDAEETERRDQEREDDERRRRRAEHERQDD